MFGLNHVLSSNVRELTILGWCDVRPIDARFFSELDSFNAYLFT